MVSAIGSNVDADLLLSAGEIFFSLLQVVVLGDLGIESELLVEVRVALGRVHSFVCRVLLAQLDTGLAESIWILICFDHSSLLARRLDLPLSRLRPRPLRILPASTGLSFLICEKIWTVYLPILFYSLFFLLTLCLELLFDFLIDSVDVPHSAILAV